MKKANQPGLSKLNLTVFKQIILAGCLATLVACGGTSTSSGGFGDSGGPPRVKRNLSVQSTGVTQPGLVLQTNSGDELAITENGTHYFNEEVPANDEYAITVKEQPVGEVCTVNNGSGLAVTDVIGSVTCSSSAEAYTIGVVVTGLGAAGNTIVLVNNGNDQLIINGDGQFIFGKPVAKNGSYRIIMASQPPLCYLANGAGDNVQANVTNVEVVCSDG